MRFFFNFFNYSIDEDSVYGLFSYIDIDKTGKISFFELSKKIYNDSNVDVQFLLKKIKKKMMSATNDEEEILRLFQEIDRDHNNSITLNELESAFIKFNLKLNSEEILSVFNNFDKERTNKISYKVIFNILLI